MAADDIETKLLRAIGCLCEEISALRDDLYNHALITRGESFSLAAAAPGQRSFTTADMPTAQDTPPTTAVAKKVAYDNRGAWPVVVLLRVSPFVSSFPANALALENAYLLWSMVGADKITPAAAEGQKVSMGETVAVLLPAGKQLFIGVLATGTVTITWTPVPLRGRRMVFGGG